MSFIKTTIISAEAHETALCAKHSSGLKVYICEKASLGTNYAVFGTHYGSVDTQFSLNDGEMITVPEGIAHFLEHKLFEGKDGDAFEKYAVTGASANAYTSFDRTCYLFSCSNRFYENLNILLDFVSSPYFTPETVAKEQGIIGQEIKMYEDVPGWRVLFNLFKILYHNHPIKVEIAGTVKSIAQITDQTLYSCYNTFYNPSNMFICLCGDFDTEKVLDIIEQKIKPIERAEIHRSEFDEPDSIVSDYVELNMPVSQPLFVAGIKDNSTKFNVTAKTCAETELLLELAIGKISPLYNRLLNDELINKSFGTEFFHGYGYSALLFEGESKNPKAVKDAIINELKNIAENGVDTELFQDAKKKLYGHEVRRFDDVEETVNEFIDSAIFGFKPYETLSALKNVTENDIVLRAKQLDLKKTALSVIKNF